MGCRCLPYILFFNIMSHQVCTRCVTSPYNKSENCDFGIKCPVQLLYIPREFIRREIILILVTAHLVNRIPLEIINHASILEVQLFHMYYDQVYCQIYFSYPLNVYCISPDQLNDGCPWYAQYEENGQGNPYTLCPGREWLVCTGRGCI